jgi:hypothetical protein
MAGFFDIQAVFAILFLALIIRKEWIIHQRFLFWNFKKNTNINLLLILEITYKSIIA